MEQRLKMRAQIEDIAGRGRVTVRNGEVVFPVVDRMHALQHAFVAAAKVEDQRTVIGKVIVQEPDLLSMFVRINKTAILKDLESQVEGVAGGLTGQERAERVQNLLSGTGAAGAALLRDALDIAGRIAELLFLFDQADRILADALVAPLTRVDLDLPAHDGVVVDDDDDAPG